MAITSQPLGQILKEMGKVSELDIQEALQTQKDKGGAIGKILVDKGLVKDEDIRLAIARQSGMDPVDLGEIVMTSDLLDMVPAHVAETYQVIPVDFDGSVLTLALADPQNVSALDDMKFMLNVEVYRYLITKQFGQYAEMENSRKILKKNIFSCFGKWQSNRGYF